MPFFFSFCSTKPFRNYKSFISLWLFTSVRVSLDQVRNSELTEVNRTEFMTPSAFIFLYENHLFLTFRNRTVAVWNFRGELVTSFEDHLLWHPDCNTNNIYITSDQDLIISYCKAEEGCEDDGEGNFENSISALHHGFALLP